MARITEAFRVEECPGEEREGRQCVRLLEPLVYHVGSDDSREVITVPAGFVTDFASIPFGLRNLFPPLGRWARAAIVHDFIYSRRGVFCAKGPAPNGEIGDISYTRKQADGIFLEAMEVVGVPGWQRSVMYRAVRLGGGKGWGS